MLLHTGRAIVQMAQLGILLHPACNACGNAITRQMMIIAGGEPELCCSMARCAKREGGVYVRPYAFRVQNAVWTCCTYAEKCEKGFV